MIKRIRVALALALLTILLFPALALATVDLPTSYGIDGVMAYQNVFETGDMLFKVTGTITYTVLPTGYTATDLFLIRLRTAAGVDIRAVKPVSYYNRGFQYFVSIIYFTKAEVTALVGTLAWGDITLVMNICGNPSYAWTGGIAPSANFSPFTKWDTAIVSADVSKSLGDDVITDAKTTETAWGGIASYVKLWQQVPGAEQLTSVYTGMSYFGETYFLAIFPELRICCPQLFSVVVTSPIVNPASTTMTYFTSLEGRLVGTRFDMTFIAADFHMPRILFSTLIWLILTALLIGAVVRRVGSFKVFGAIMVMLLPVGTMLGFVSAVFCAAIIIGAFILLILNVVMNRA